MEEEFTTHILTKMIESQSDPKNDKTLMEIVVESHNSMAVKCEKLADDTGDINYLMLANMFKYLATSDIQYVDRVKELMGGEDKFNDIMSTVTGGHDAREIVETMFEGVFSGNVGDTINILNERYDYSNNMEMAADMIREL
jgi:hypothetical protein